MSSLTKRQKETGLIVLAAILLLAVAAYSYFSVFAPAREARIQAEQTLKSEREVVMALQEQLKALPMEEKVSTKDLQKKVSVEPLTELIVLQIEQAELVSDSIVKSIAVSENPLELLTPVEGIENVQKLQTDLQIEAPDYESITAFIKEIEAMNRILVIEAINFQSNGEIVSADQEDGTLELTLSFSAFFRPDLIALADTLPKVDAPAPAKKSNPLPQNDGTDLAVSDEDEVLAEEETVGAEVGVDIEAEPEAEIENDTASAEPNPYIAAAQTVKYHKVEKGDTLFSIAIKYFNSRDGEALIMKANDMQGQTVKTGTALIIPAQP